MGAFALVHFDRADSQSNPTKVISTHLTALVGSTHSSATINLIILGTDAQTAVSG
jgi:hypothetical protein